MKLRLVLPTLAVLGMLLGTMTLPAIASEHMVLAQEGEEGGGEATTTTVSPFPPGGEPAVTVPPVEIKEAVQPWTARFVYPALIGLAIILPLGLLLYYLVRIKGRYRVVS